MCVNVMCVGVVLWCVDIVVLPIVSMIHTCSGVFRNNSIWDWLIFSRVQKGLGGQIRIMITGSAPISGTVLDFLRVASGAYVRPW